VRSMMNKKQKAGAFGEFLNRCETQGARSCLICIRRKQKAGISRIPVSYERGTPVLVLDLLPRHDALSVSVCGVAETQAWRALQPKSQNSFQPCSPGHVHTTPEPSVGMPQVKPVHTTVSKRATPSSSLALRTQWTRDAKSNPWAASTTLNTNP